jgi:hypothetical protein
MMDIFKQAYVNLICEDWDRFEYLDIIRATNLVTNNCTDPWVKGETGKKVFAFLRENGFRSRGGKTISFSGFYDNDNADQVSNSDIEKIKGENRFYNGSAAYDESYITAYWRARTNSNSSFDAKTFATIWKYSYKNEYRKFEVLAPDVGTIVYGVWKALNSRFTKIENNKKDVEENGVDYTEGQKVSDVNLTVTGIKTTVGKSAYGYSYSEAQALTAIDDKNWSFKIRLGRNTSTKLAELIGYAEQHNLFEYLEENFPHIKKINISGKILRVNTEWKTITVNYVTINSPADADVETVLTALKDEAEKRKKLAKATKEANQTLKTLDLVYNSWNDNKEKFAINDEMKTWLQTAIDSIPTEIYEGLDSSNKKLIELIKTEMLQID